MGLRTALAIAAAIAAAIASSTLPAQDPGRDPAGRSRPDPAALRRLLPQSNIVLADATDPVPLRAFGLGDGGLKNARVTGALRWADGGCVTPAGIRIECLRAGVKLTFPTGRELLFAPDGALHLRDGTAGGPFPTGVELRLGDGTSVRVKLSQAQRIRVRDVVVQHGRRALRPYRKGKLVREIARPGFWGGPRVCCCGDGGELYRAIALGPLVTLDRVLVPQDRLEDAPSERLVVLTRPLLDALSELTRRHRTPEPDVKRAVAAVNATVQRGQQIFPSGKKLRRAEHDNLRWLLRGGFELELALDGPRAPRLSLFAGRSIRPMVEWSLGINSAVFLNNPRSDQPGASRWRGNGVALPRTVLDLQPRDVLFERQLALALIRRLRD